MNNSNYYIITPNKKPNFEIDIDKFQASLISDWNKSQLTGKIGDLTEKNVFNFKLIDELLEEKLSCIISNDKAVIALESRLKCFLFEFVIWLIKIYPEKENLYLFNDNNKKEFTKLSSKTEVKNLKDVFID